MLIPKDFEYDLYNLNLVYARRRAAAEREYVHRSPSPVSVLVHRRTRDDLWRRSGQERTSVQQSQAGHRRAAFELAGDGAWSCTVGAFYKSLDNQLKRSTTRSSGPSTSPRVLPRSRRVRVVCAVRDVGWSITDRLEVGAGVRYFEETRPRFRRHAGRERHLRFRRFRACTPRSSWRRLESLRQRGKRLSQRRLQSRRAAELRADHCGATKSVSKARARRPFGFEGAVYYRTPRTCSDAVSCSCRTHNRSSISSPAISARWK